MVVRLGLTTRPTDAAFIYLTFINSYQTFLKFKRSRRYQSFTSPQVSIFPALGHQAEHVFWQQRVHFSCLRLLADVCECVCANLKPVRFS